jgi:hypothetical protein
VKLGKLLQYVLLSTITHGLQSSGHAQVNLVNLYDFTGETQNGYSANQGIDILSFDSVVLICAYGTNGPPSLSNLIEPILTGNMNTTPDATYEISYIVSHGPPDFIRLPVYVSFGNFPIDVGDAVLAAEQDSPTPYAALSYDYTKIATSTTTALTFDASFIDEADSIVFSNISVMEVPETSVAGLFGFGACTLLLAQRWRGLFPKRERY